MTVDDALKIIHQERLDVMAEGMSAEECSQIAAYVLHDAVLKDRKFILKTVEQKISAQDEVFRLAELLKKADPSWGSPMHLNSSRGQGATANAPETPSVNQAVFGSVLAVGEPCVGGWSGPPQAWEWLCRCGAKHPSQCKTETAKRG